MIKAPTLDNLRVLSDQYNLKLNDEELKIYSNNIEKQLQSFNTLTTWENPAQVDKAKYEERKPYRARAEENPYNAWYQKVNIVGNNDPSKILHGYKVAIKDCVDIANVPLMMGTKIMEGYVPETDATVVTRILDNGGTIIGSATCDTLCFGGNDYNTTLYGPVRNPWNTEYSASGSSSGSAVVVTIGDADVSLGGDQGGSIRYPASICGIVGLKPTYGLVPYTGIISLESTLDHVGPMARTVADCARLLTAIAGFDDGKDFRQPSCGFHAPNYLDEVLSVKLGTLRIGILKEGFVGCDKSTLNCINHAIDLIKQSGKFLNVQDVSVPDHEKGDPIFWSVFNGFLNQGLDSYGHGTGCSGLLSPNLVEKFAEGLKDHLHTVHPSIKAYILFAAYLKHYNKTAFFSNYAKAQNWAWRLKKEYDDVLSTVDVLLLPTIRRLPQKMLGPDATVKDILADDMDSIVTSTDHMSNFANFNLTHLPAITLNAGYDNDTGLPIGLQLVGGLWEDATVLKAAALIEDVLKPLQRPFPK